MSHEYYETSDINDFEIPAGILGEMAESQGAAITQEDKPKEIKVTPEYAFSTQAFAEMINETMIICKGICAKANRQRKAESMEREHERKVMAKRTGVQFVPSQSSLRPTPKAEEMHTDLIGAAMLHLFSTSRKWGGAFNAVARQTEAIFDQLEETKKARTQATDLAQSMIEAISEDTTKRGELQKRLKESHNENKMLQLMMNQMKEVSFDDASKPSIIVVDEIKFGWLAENRPQKAAQFEITTAAFTMRSLALPERMQYENFSNQSLIENEKWTSDHRDIKLVWLEGNNQKKAAQYEYELTAAFAMTMRPFSRQMTYKNVIDLPQMLAFVKAWPLLSGVPVRQVSDLIKAQKGMQSELATQIKRIDSQIAENGRKKTVAEGIPKETYERGAILQETLKLLKDVVICYDAQPVRKYLKEPISYQKIKEIRAIFFELVSDEASTLRQKHILISRHVTKGICDTAMPIAEVTDRLLRNVRGEASFSRTSRAQRDSESVYQDSNDVAILDAETAYITTQLLSLLGYNNGSLIEVTNGGRVEVAIQEIEETIRIFEKTLEKQQEYGEHSDLELDAVTIFDMTVTCDALREQLDAYTAPRCTGTAYALGSGGLRKLYVTPS